MCHLSATSQAAHQRTHPLSFTLSKGYTSSGFIGVYSMGLRKRGDKYNPQQCHNWELGHLSLVVLRCPSGDCDNASHHNHSHSPALTNSAATFTGLVSSSPLTSEPGAPSDWSELRDPGLSLARLTDHPEDLTTLGRHVWRVCPVSLNLSVTNNSWHKMSAWQVRDLGAATTN